MTNLRLVSQNIRGGRLRSFAFARLERCYCSFSLFIYGNTAEDPGQLSIEVDLVRSLTDDFFCCGKA
ncbi:hypothetical protein CsSME_00046404 [Camellia sinensis var. sinensis]